jgi:integrase
MNIRNLTNGVLSELAARGYAEGTMSIFKRALSATVKWFDDEAGGQYSEESLADYLCYLQACFESGKLSRQCFNVKNRCLEHIRSYAGGGGVECGYARCGRKWFVPKSSALALIENALAETQLTDKFKYKLCSSLRRFFCFAEAQGVREQDISRDVMVAFIHHCRDVSHSQMTYIVRSLQVLSEHLISIGVMSVKLDFRFIAPKRGPRKIIPAYSEWEMSAIFAAVDRATPAGKRDYAIILLAVGTGLRAGDIAKLKFTNINWKSQSISIVQSKTGKPLTISISGQICNAVAEYILNGRPNVECGNIFLREHAPFSSLEPGSALSKIIDRACDRAGIEKKRGRCFHSLRRTFGTWLAAEQIPITTISQMLGHAEINSGKPYLSFDDTQIYSCAMGFDGIPLKGGVYNEFH